MSNMAALFLRVLPAVSDFNDSNEVHTTIDAELSLVEYQNKVSSFEFEV